MFAGVFIILVVVTIFVYDFGYRWWRETEWKRRRRRRDDWGVFPASRRSPRPLITAITIATMPVIAASHSVASAPLLAQACPSRGEELRGTQTLAARGLGQAAIERDQRNLLAQLVLQVEATGKLNGVTGA